MKTTLVVDGIEQIEVDMDGDAITQVARVMEELANEGTDDHMDVTEEAS